MKSWIILIVVAVATTVTASVALPLLSEDSSAKVPRPTAAPVDVSASAPEVEVIEPLGYEFGVKAQDTEWKHEWMFKNVGKGTLELRNLGTDCSCTVAQIGKPDEKGNKKTMLPVSPGGAEPIELTWNTRQINGSYRKSARIGTNDPRKPEIVLSVQGKVYPAVTVYPTDAVVNFLTVSNDENVIRKAAVYSQDMPGMKITELKWSNRDLLDVKLDPMGPEELAGFKVEAGHTVTITLKPSDKLGAFKEEILLQTDHPEKREVRIWVTGRITGPVTFAPERLVIHDANLTEGGSTSSVVWVRGRADTKVSVEKAPPGVEVAFAPIALPDGVSGTKFRMMVKVVPGTPAGQIKDEIVLKTDHPKASEIRVPVDIMVQGGN